MSGANFSERDDDDIVAAEYALGLLSGDDAAAIEARLRIEAPLSLRVAWWRDQLSPLVDETAVEPAHSLWSGIAAQLGANDNPPARDPARLWKWATAGVSSIAAALLVMVAMPPAAVLPVPAPVPASPPPMVASLSGKRGMAVAVAYDPTNSRMLVTPIVLNAANGDVELWVIPDGATIPVSLGVIDAKVAGQHKLDARHSGLLTPGATFAVSQEVKGGSPTGAPQGPVIASGKITQV